MLVAAAGPLLARCASKTGADVSATSSLEDGHTHSFTIPGTAISASATAAYSGTGSTADGHSHQVNVTAAQLVQLANGGSVTLSDQPAGSGPHQHTYTFTPAAA
jgi:hypothetical protein